MFYVVIRVEITEKTTNRYSRYTSTLVDCVNVIYIPNAFHTHSMIIAAVKDKKRGPSKSAANKSLKIKPNT